MSEEIDELRKGRLRRILMVMAGLGALVVALVWGLAAGDRGEPELAHRVLIVGGTPTDLVEAIAEAGFEATQISWDEAREQCSSEPGEFGVELLIECADERGAGFLALMFGEDMTVGRKILGEVAPEHADAAVISVGELAPEGPRVRFGAPPHRIEYALGMRRSEALRMALYDHPDLLALWDTPTAKQLGQQIELQDLDEARTRLELALARYAAAIDAWPSEWPVGAIVEPWTETQGMLVEGGRVVREQALSAWVNEYRRVELRRAAPQLRFVPERGSASATTIDPGTPHFMAAQGDEGLFFLDETWQRWRFGAGPPTRIDTTIEPGLELAAFSAGGSMFWSGSRERIWSTSTGETAALAIWVERRCATWIDDEMLALCVALLDPSGDWIEWIAVLDLRAGERPKLVSLALDELVPSGFHPEILGLHSSPAGLDLLTRDQDQHTTLTRIAIDPQALRAAMIAEDPEQRPRFMVDEDSIQAQANQRTLAEIGASKREFELSSGFVFDDSIVVAPDGSWLLWRESTQVQAARIVAGKLQITTIGEAIEAPQISADSQHALLWVERELPGLGPLRYLRLVPRPQPR